MWGQHKTALEIKSRAAAKAVPKREAPVIKARIRRQEKPQINTAMSRNEKGKNKRSPKSAEGPPTPPLPETYLPSRFLALPSAPSHYLIPSLPWAPTATSSAVSVHYIQAQRLASLGRQGPHQLVLMVTSVTLSFSLTLLR